MPNWQWRRRELLKTVSVATVGGVNAATARGAAESDLALALNAEKSTLAPGETVDVTVTATNQSGTDAPIKLEYHFIGTCPCTGLVVDLIPPDLRIANSAQDTYTQDSVSAGESITFSTTLLAPDDLDPGNYNPSFAARLGSCPGGDRCDPEELPSQSSASTAISVQQPKQLDLSVKAGTAPPGGTYTLSYTIENTGSAPIGDGTNSRTVVAPELNQGPPGFTTNERSIPDGGAVDGFTWFDWSIDPGETLTAELQVALEQSGVGPAPGDYEFTIVAENNAQSREFDRASGTVTVMDSGQNSFDPEVHGFGFPNWGGTDGCRTEVTPTTRSRSCNSETFSLPFDNPLTLTEARDYVNRSYSSLAPAIREIQARLLYQFVARQTVTDGHCYGMVFAAQQYFQTPEALPAGADTASDAPRPTGPFESIGRQIRAYHTSQGISGEVYQFLWGSKLGVVDLHNSKQVLMKTLDQQPTVPVALDSSTAGAHQLLVYDYSQANDSTTFDVYDPNYAADASTYDPAVKNEIKGRRQLRVDSQTAELTGLYATYDTYAPLDVALNTTLVEGILTVNSLSELFAPLGNAISWELNSPASLTVDAPDTATVIRGAGELVDQSRVADAATVIGAAPEEVGVAVNGRGTGEYTLTTYGVEEGTAVVEDQATGRITPEETIQYQVQPANGSGDGGLKRKARTDSPLSGVAGEYDANNDGTITARELGAAVTDFGQGELSARELGEVVTAFGQS